MFEVKDVNGVEYLINAKDVVYITQDVCQLDGREQLITTICLSTKDKIRTRFSFKKICKDMKKAK